MDTQFTASQHLNGPGHLSWRMSTGPRSASFIVWSGTRKLYLRKSSCFRLELVWIRPIDPECWCSCQSTVPTQLLHILCTCAHLFVSQCCSQFLVSLVTCTDDPHRLKRAIEPQVRSQLISLSINAVASVNKLWTSQCLRILEQIIFGSQRKYIAHGSGAVIQWRRTWQKSWNLLQDRFRMTTMRGPDWTSVSSSRTTSHLWTRSTCGECSSGNWRVLRAHTNVEPHTVRLVGGTDHRTKLETGTASTFSKRVWSLETVGGGKRTEDCGSKIRSRVVARIRWQSEKVRGSVACVETPGGRLREIGLATSKLDDDVKISVVLREAPTKFRDNLLVNSQQFESNKNKKQVASYHPSVSEIQQKLDCEWLQTRCEGIRPDGSWPQKQGQGQKQRQRQRQKQRQGDEARQPRHKSATCAKREGNSRETVGHEQTMTEQLTR